jgi:hypothetical protein
MPCWEYRSHLSLRTLQYAMISIGLVRIPPCSDSMEEGKGKIVVTTPDRLDVHISKRLHVQVS